MTLLTNPCLRNIVLQHSTVFCTKPDHAKCEAEGYRLLVCNAL